MTPDVHQRHCSPPQDRRPQARARYGVSISSRDDVQIAKDDSAGKHAKSRSNTQDLVARVASWAEAQRLWLPHNGSHVQVVAAAVIDAVQHPCVHDILRRHAVPVTVLSSAAETAAGVQSDLRFSFLEVKGSFKIYQEEMYSGQQLHVVPVVMLQACEPGIPDSNDMVRA